ncbi:MAG: hypothetical protein ACQER9_01465 [Nanobdellota archaeon]
MEEVTSFLFVAPAVIGILVSLVEIFFVMGDEGGMHPLSHGLHAVPTCIIFTYISMNAIVAGNYLAQYVGFFNNPLVSKVSIPILIGLIATLKVKSAASIVSGGHSNVGEKLPHALIVGAIIAAAPFIYPFIAPMLPSFLTM